VTHSAKMVLDHKIKCERVRAATACRGRLKGTVGFALEGLVSQSNLVIHSLRSRSVACGRSGPTAGGKGATVRREAAGLGATWVAALQGALSTTVKLLSSLTTPSAAAAETGEAKATRGEGGEAARERGRMPEPCALLTKGGGDGAPA
jgi:hypothetical protein